MFNASRSAVLAMLASFLALALGACASTSPAATGDDRRSAGRLLYEIELTAPGTRSQGWRGALYDPKGVRVDIAVGASIDANVGRFRRVDCVHLWDVCGMIHEGDNANVILGAEPWTYRLYVSAECTRSEGWWGELARAGENLAPQSETIVTPMGPFVARHSPHAFGQHGWFPVSWGAPSSGHWPCAAR
jgi:hypothetical protein